jgi:2-haloalkanoic acid dehalogenase type II
MAILAFDIYGTIFDVSSISKKLKVKESTSFLTEWRRKQIEYTWLSNILGKWIPFDEVTKLSLKYVSELFRVEFREELINLWDELEPFPDSKEISRLKEKHRLFALTNGVRGRVMKMLINNSMGELFEEVVTAEEVKEYKPSRRVYEHFMRKVNAKEIYLVSSNPFDVIGSKNAGMKAIYVKRGVFDPIGYSPDFIVQGLNEIYKLNI